MEVDFYSSKDSGAKDDDEDDQIISRQKARGRRRVVIDDDEDEEEKENTLAVSLLRTEVEDAAAVYNKQQVDICDKQQKDTADVCSIEKTVDSVGLESKRLNKMSGSHIGLDSDDDADENFAHSDDDDDDHDDDTAATEQEERVILQESSAAQDVTPRQRFDLNSDIFDTESCDNDSYPGVVRTEEKDFGSKKHHSAEDHAEISDENGADSEEFEDGEISADLMARLKRLKGASKSEKERTKYSRKAKPKAEEMMEIYSESQRLLRDSRVNLPYYEPEPKPLEDFLARASKKRQEYAALIRPKDIQKAQIICDKLSLSPLTWRASPRKPGCKSGASPSVIKSKKSEMGSQSSPSCQPSRASDSGFVSCEVSASDFELGHVKSSDQQPKFSAVLNSDDLPDLLPSQSNAHTIGGSQRTHSAKERLDESRSDLDSGQGNKDEIIVPSLRKDPSRDLFKSQSTVGDETEQVPLQTQNLLEGPESMKDGSVHCVRVNEGVEDDKDISESCVITQTSQKDHYSSVSANKAEDSVARTVSCVGNSRKKSLDRFKGLDLPAEPSLLRTPDNMICLDSGQPSPLVKNPGLVKLMDRLVQHSKMNATTPGHDAAPRNPDNEEEEKQLGPDCEVDKEETDGHTGSKLDKLKQQLGVGMRRKREEARQRRLQLFALENEEGFEKEKEEEEAEMTEGSDTDDDDEEEEEEAEGSEESVDDIEEEEEDLKQKLISGHDSDEDEDYNPFVEKEAKDEDEESSDSDVHLHFDVSEDEEENSLEDRDSEDGEKDEHEIHLEEEKDENGDGITSQRKEQENSGFAENVDSDENDEQDKSGDVTNKTENKELIDSQKKWSSEMTPLSKHLLDTQQQIHSGFKSENSLDRYSAANHVEDTASATDQLTQSQMLDADGFLKLAQTQPQKSRISMLAEVASSDDDVGRHFRSSLEMSVGEIFHGSGSQTDRGRSCSQDMEDSMKQLLGLCSGTFGSREDLQYAQSHEVRATQSFHVQASTDNQDDDGDDDDVYDPFHVLSDVEDDTTVEMPHKKRKGVLSDSEDESQEYSNQDAFDEDDDAASNSSHNDHFTGLKENKKRMRNEFLEEEAELSGSEFDSDEDVDLDEEDDILEEEAGDLDMQGVSSEKLRDEVGRLHMKQLQDEDEREVMRFKEMYLQDGDLYSEGGGRMRNFRWKDVDQGSQPDMFSQNSGDEQADDDADDVHWRKDRFEREKFIEEEGCNTQAEDSQVLKLGQFFLQRQESIPQAKEPVTTSVAQKVISKPDKPVMQKRGSFLSRGRDTLVKIAQVVKTTTGGSSAKTSRNFVFHTIDEPAGEDPTEEPPPTVVGKRKSHDGISTPQTAKKPKVASATANTSLGETNSRSKCIEPKSGLQRQSSFFTLLQEI